MRTLIFTQLNMGVYNIVYTSAWVTMSNRVTDHDVTEETHRYAKACGVGRNSWQIHFYLFLSLSSKSSDKAQGEILVSLQSEATRGLLKP